MMSFLPVPAADFVVLSGPLDMSHEKAADAKRFGKVRNSGDSL